LHPLALLQLGGMRAGQQQQAEVEGVAKKQAAERGRNHCRHAQVSQRTGGLLARGADAKVGAGGQHVACLHTCGKVRPHGLQAMLRNHVDAVLHVSARCQHIGVDVGAHAPHTRTAHASTSRGSVMRPRSAEAATV